MKAGEYPVRASEVPSTWAGAVVDSFRAAVTTFVAPVTSVVMPMDMLTGTQSAVGESGTAARAADKAFPRSARETVLIQSHDLRASAPAFKAAFKAGPLNSAPSLNVG